MAEKRLFTCDGCGDQGTAEPIHQPSGWCTIFGSVEGNFCSIGCLQKWALKSLEQVGGTMVALRG